MLSKEEIEKYKAECDLLDLTNKEIIDEAIATLINSMNRKDEGFRRVEKVALVAIHILLNCMDRQESNKQKLIEKLEEDIKIARREYRITLSDRQDGIRQEAQEILKIVKEKK